MAGKLGAELYSQNSEYIKSFLTPYFHRIEGMAVSFALVELEELLKKCSGASYAEQLIKEKIEYLKQQESF